MCVWFHIFWRQSTSFGVCLTYQPGFKNKETNTMLCRVFVCEIEPLTVAPSPHDDEELAPSMPATVPTAV